MSTRRPPNPVNAINWAALQPATLAGPVTFSSQLGFQALHLRFHVPLDHTSTTNPHRNSRSGKPSPSPPPKRLELSANLIYAHSSSPLSPSSDGPPIPIGIAAPTALGASWLLHNHLLPPHGPRPWVVYLCGGPGDANPPFAVPEISRYVLRTRRCAVLFLDYRGTGQSSAVTARNVHVHVDGDVDVDGDGDGDGAGDKRYWGRGWGCRAAWYLGRFGQDSIVADLEAVRRLLGGVKYVLLGQSFGGWVATTYLSFLPEGLEGVYVAGGLPPVGKGPREVYTALFARLHGVNEEYYRRYPEDVWRMRVVVRALAAVDEGRGVQLPLESGGGRLTVRGFLTLGRWFGAGEEGLRKVHFFVAMFAQDCADGGGITETTIQRFVDEGGTGFRLPRRPLYGVLHEAIYCYKSRLASDWAAQHVGRAQTGPFFRWLHQIWNPLRGDPVQPLYFSSEMIFQFMLEDAGPALEPFIVPAKILAGRNDWPMLYDRAQLRRNKVPMRALIYPADLFLDYAFSTETARMIANCTADMAPPDWTHGSIKTRTSEVLTRLMGNGEGVVVVPKSKGVKQRHKRR